MKYIVKVSILKGLDLGEELKLIGGDYCSGRGVVIQKYLVENSPNFFKKVPGLEDAIDEIFDDYSDQILPNGLRADLKQEVIRLFGRVVKGEIDYDD